MTWIKFTWKLFLKTRLQTLSRLKKRFCSLLFKAKDIIPGTKNFDDLEQFLNQAKKEKKEKLIAENKSWKN